MRFVRGFFWLVLILQLAHAKGSADLIVCGMEKVFIISAEVGESPRWEWTAELSAEIPESMRGALRRPNDCKPYRGHLLITSSSGGVALVERETRKCSFFTKVRNAHSACLFTWKFGCGGFQFWRRSVGDFLVWENRDHRLPRQ